jgi:UDP-N-acetyl-D-mannosaminuronic acid transferase (WecB/TagA/CpsF family)
MAMVVDGRAREYGQVMAEQAGLSIGTFVDAIHAKQAALSRQHAAAAEADHVFREALASAYAATVDGVGRLDAIAAEIDRAVESRVSMGIDTPMGAREFQKFLTAKRREIFAVVSDAHELDNAKRVALENLLQHYTASTG